MKFKFTLEPDGSLHVDEGNGTTRRVDASQIAAHRRDPAFEAALHASRDLTAAQKAALPAPK